MLIQRLLSGVEVVLSIPINPMPRKTQRKYLAPTLVLERVRAWGLCIRNLQLQHRRRASDLCECMSITHSTLRRLENGDVGGDDYL
jgi:hypothetical protein